MKYSNILTAILMQCTINALSSIRRADPLQPVWDSLEQLPAKILGELNQKMNSLKLNMDLTIDQEIEQFKKNLTAMTTAPDRSREEHDVTKNRLADRLTAFFEDFYNSNMKDDHEFGIAYDADSINEALLEVESKITRHLDHALRKADLFFEFDSTIEDHVFEIAHHGESLLSAIDVIDRKVANVRELLLPGRQDVCIPLEEDLQRFIEEKLPSEQRLAEFEREWEDTYQAVAKDVPKVFFQRDCAEILLSKPNSPSGVYTIYPSRDGQTNTNVWCDMDTANDDGSEKGGWTVVLRRRNTTAGLLNFNRSWDEYSSGFGQPSDLGEWWMGLKWVHQLTYHQPYQLFFLVRDIQLGHFQAHFSNFRVEDEFHNFILIVDGFSGNVTDVFTAMHHGQPFSTPDRDNDDCDTCNCAVNNQGGWWFNKCHRAVLTAPFPTSGDRGAKTIRWLNGNWLVLDDVLMMIKPTN